MWKHESSDTALILKNKSSGAWFTNAAVNDYEEDGETFTIAEFSMIGGGDEGEKHRMLVLTDGVLADGGWGSEGVVMQVPNSTVWGPAVLHDAVPHPTPRVPV